MTVCGGWSIVQARWTATRAITMFCRSWSCPDCAPRRRAALKRAALDGKPTKFLTLTIKDRECSVEEQALLLSDAFRKLIKRWRRHKKGAEVEYLAVFEPHPTSGRPHLHVMLRAPYTRQEWLSRQMKDLLDSPIVDIRAITDRRKVARYVAKYITKSNIRFGTAKRYWASPRYAPKPEKFKKAPGPLGDTFFVSRSPLWLLARGWEALGRIVEWTTDHEVFSFSAPATAPPSVKP